VAARPLYIGLAKNRHDCTLLGTGVPRVRRSTFGARAFAIAGPTVWNSLPDSLRDPAVGPDQFRRDLKMHLFEWHCVSFSALAVFSRNALYKSTFYLLYVYLHDLQPLNVDESQPFSNDANDCLADNGHDIAYDGHFQPINDSLMSNEVCSDRNGTDLDDELAIAGDQTSAPRLRVHPPRTIRRPVRYL